MKKKIKDLTEEEKLKFCKQHFSCRLCPVAIKIGDFAICIKRLCENEVEVDE